MHEPAPATVGELYAELVDYCRVIRAEMKWYSVPCLAAARWVEQIQTVLPLFPYYSTDAASADQEATFAGFRKAKNGIMNLIVQADRDRKEAQFAASIVQAMEQAPPPPPPPPPRQLQQAPPTPLPPPTRESRRAARAGAARFSRGMLRTGMAWSGEDVILPPRLDAVGYVRHVNPPGIGRALVDWLEDAVHAAFTRDDVLPDLVHPASPDDVLATHTGATLLTIYDVERTDDTGWLRPANEEDTRKLESFLTGVCETVGRAKHELQQFVVLRAGVVDQDRHQDGHRTFHGNSVDLGTGARALGTSFAQYGYMSNRVHSARDWVPSVPTAPWASLPVRPVLPTEDDDVVLTEFNTMAIHFGRGYTPPAGAEGRAGRPRYTAFVSFDGERGGVTEGDSPSSHAVFHRDWPWRHGQ